MDAHDKQSELPIVVDGQAQEPEVTFVGIDYSMTAPAVCLHTGKNWDPKNCRFFYLTNNKKFSGSFLSGTVVGELFNVYSSDTERFLLNAHAFKRWIKPSLSMFIGIEGYAFGATGSRIFQIGEATGILKTLLIHSTEGSLINNGKNLVSFAPSSVKKLATGKGNADKQMMYDAFLTETGLDLINVIGLKKLANPVHDIADSYFICKKTWTLHQS